MNTKDVQNSNTMALFLQFDLMIMLLYMILSIIVLKCITMIYYNI